MPLFQSSGSWPKPLRSRVDCCRNEALPLVKPAMVCQIKFTEWTRDDRLRQPVFSCSNCSRNGFSSSFARSTRETTLFYDRPFSSSATIAPSMIDPEYRARGIETLRRCITIRACAILRIVRIRRDRGIYSLHNRGNHPL